MDKTPFIIKGNPIDPKATYQWNEFDKKTTFIKSIDTLDIDQESNTISKVISGIPSPFGRLLMFRYALEQSHSRSEKLVHTGLAAFYDQIITEWRAVIATLAIFGEKIQIQKVSLSASLSKEHSYYNPYELSAGLGTMLFEDRDIWCDLVSVPETGSDQLTPFIQLLYYQEKREEEKVLIGGTSPYSLLFTPPEISWSSNAIPVFYNRTQNRWIDPLKVKLTEKDVQAIYGTVYYALFNLGSFFEKVNKERAGSERVLRKSSLEQHLRAYQEDLIRYADNQRYDLKRHNLFTSKTHFHSPFGEVFNAESTLFLSYQNGIFYRRQDREGQYISVNPSEFLMGFSTLIEIGFGEDESADHCASYLLKCGDAHFALPLSEKGLCIFEHQISDLLTGKRNDQPDHHLFAEATKHGIRVTLRIKYNVNEPGQPITDTDFTEVTRLYHTSSAARMTHQKVIVWPDFVSKNWEKYYLYSDLPHNDPKRAVTTIPLIGIFTEDGISFKRSGPSGLDTFSLSRKIGLISDDRIDESNPSLILRIPPEVRVGYEIFESNLPFKGVELKYGEGDNTETAGFLVAKVLPNASKDIVSLDVMNVPSENLQPATVGMDFGSNNTAFSYFINNKELKLVQIISRRICLMGSDRPEGKVYSTPASVSELFFFQKEPINGQVKSMLVAHNENRMLRVEDRKRAARAGFPLFENNIPVTGKPTNNASTNYLVAMGSGEESRLKYNMKWDLDQRENDYKYTFLKTLWIQILAELYRKGYYPNRLAWAVPGAMSKSIQGHYTNLWKDVIKDPELYPVVNGNQGAMETELMNPISEGEAVARYALNSDTDDLPGGGLSISEGGLVIGLDIGGSTTDILLATKGDSTQVESYSLIKEGSILLSASAIAKAAIRSRNIQDVLRSFVRNNRKFVQQYGIDQLDEQTTEFHLNALFDRLDGKQLEQLYAHFYQQNCKEIFAVAAYVTGAILFYVGQMVAHVIEAQGISANRFALGIYGKGGNIFNWLPAIMPQDAVKYYKKCFLAGLNPSGRIADLTSLQNDIPTDEVSHLNTLLKFYQEVKFEFSNTTKFQAHRAHNKSEVAYGLSSPQNLRKKVQEALVTEIIGEKGYVYVDSDGKAVELPTLNPMESKYLNSFGKTSFRTPSEFSELKRFIEVYASFVQELQLADYEILMEGVDALPQDYFSSYVVALPQFRAAKEIKDFDFSASMFVLEAMCLMEKILLPSLFD